ncbi:hypothetical protein CKO_01447 [Citrobacter koseri ATCC BAA-895]|uniref:Uncharacterized protein n=1 Tax=Citrobacter koseri (strain ATCC BAA-895 / CDC 4225-83 / SGSC4696) TaxID=290338 RepID=A8AGG7_CITK8|nr:hypothetical protein CKO_01447 [Citrobacter koseri ATCC BAA-895]
MHWIMPETVSFSWFFLLCSLQSTGVASGEYQITPKDDPLIILW